MGPTSASDRIAIKRLRRVLVEHIGELLTLDRHIARLDNRSVRYAGSAVEHLAPTPTGD